MCLGHIVIQRVIETAQISSGTLPRSITDHGELGVFTEPKGC